jgi:hypothetical protein
VNKEIVLPHSIPAAAHLHEGDPIKISGRWQSEEFVPHKIKIKKMKGINLEEIEGPIDHIDRDSKSFNALGLHVAITERTSVEGLFHATNSANF